MATPQLSREEQLIAYFVSACSGRIGRTRLMKLLYLSDLESRQVLGRPITGIEYIWYHYGPYDRSFDGKLSSLRRKGVIRESYEIFPSGLTGYVYTTGDTVATYQLSPAELEIAGYVCREFSRVELRDLLDDIVYQTEPMVAAQQTDARDQALDMSIMDNRKARELPLPFEELLARSQRMDAGEHYTHEDVMAAARELALRSAA